MLHPCARRRAASGSRSSAGRASAGSTPRSWPRSPPSRAAEQAEAFLDALALGAQVERDLAGDRPRDRGSGCCGWRARCSSCPGLRAASLLDPSPLARSLEGWIDWDALHANVAGGVIHAVCVVATSLERGLPVGLRGDRRAAAALGPRDPLRAHAAGGPARARVGGDPAAVPAGRGDRAAGRLRALRRRRDAAERADRARAGARRRARDRRRLRAAGRRRARRPRPAGCRGWRTSPPTRSTACCSTRSPTTCAGCSPSTRSSPSRPPPAPHARPAPTARRTAARRTAGSPTRWWRRRDGARSARWPRRSSRSATAACAACARRTSRCSRGCSAAAARPSRGELLSFILFDEVFIERLLQAGRADAKRWLADHPGFWSSDAAAAGFEAAGVSSDTIALDEFRALRRR